MTLLPNIFVWAGITVLALMVVVLLAGRIGALGQDIHAYLYRLLHSIHRSLRSAKNAAFEYRKGEFDTEVTIKAALGGAVCICLCFLLSWADFALLKLTLGSLLPGEDFGWDFQVAGKAFHLSPPETLALAYIFLGITTGLLFFEAISWTHLMGWLFRGMTNSARKGVAIGSAAVLLMLCLTSVGMSVWRTHQMQLSADIVNASGGGVDLLGSDGNATEAAVTVPSNDVEAESWYNTLPQPILAFISFLVPMSAAVTGIGLYPVLSVAGFLAWTLVICLPLAILTNLSGILFHLAGGDVDSADRAAAEYEGKNASDNSSSPVTPVAPAAPGPPKLSTGDKSLRQESTSAQPGEPQKAPSSDPEDLFSSLSTNPLGVDDSIWDGIKQESRAREEERRR